VSDGRPQEAPWCTTPWVFSAGRVVHVITDDETAAACPACGVISTSVRQRRVTRPRDLPQGEEPLAVRWRKKQYACKERLCKRKAFTEQIAEALCDHIDLCAPLCPNGT